MIMYQIMSKYCKNVSNLGRNTTASRKECLQKILKNTNTRNEINLFTIIKFV